MPLLAADGFFNSRAQRQGPNISPIAYATVFNLRDTR
jgi:hypothetical protein